MAPTAQRKRKRSGAQCAPCEALATPLRGKELRAARARLGPEWKLVRQHHLEREYGFPDFRAALAFTNRVGKLAERVGHHPDIWLAWGKVRLVIWTHALDGLSEHDFTLAAQADQLY